jgi:hypothetical protein
VSLRPYATIFPGFESDKMLDLFEVASRSKEVNNMRASHTPIAARNIHIGYPPCNDNDLLTAYVEVPTYEANDASDLQRQYFSATYFGHQFFSCSVPSLMIAWDSLPSTDRLLQAFEVSIHDKNCNVGPFWKLQMAFREFAHHYCDINGDVPLVRAEIY